MERIEKIINFEIMQELHYGFGYAFAFIPFLHDFKVKNKYYICDEIETEYTQNGILPNVFQIVSNKVDVQR